MLRCQTSAIGSSEQRLGNVGQGLFQVALRLGLCHVTLVLGVCQLTLGLGLSRVKLRLGLPGYVKVRIMSGNPPEFTRP